MKLEGKFDNYTNYLKVISNSTNTQRRKYFELSHLLQKRSMVPSIHKLWPIHLHDHIDSPFFFFSFMHCLSKQHTITGSYLLVQALIHKLLKLKSKPKSQRWDMNLLWTIVHERERERVLPWDSRGCDRSEHCESRAKDLGYVQQDISSSFFY